MNVAPWVARLQEAGTPFLQVAGAAELEAAMVGGLKSNQAAFVIPLAHGAAPNERVNAVYQRIPYAVGVVIVVRNLQDAQGGKAQASLDTCWNWVKGKLLGWVPTTDHEPVEYEGGRMVALANGFLWWQDDWSSAFSITSS